MFIGDNYKIESDRYNLILYKKVTQEQVQAEILVALANGEEIDSAEEIGNIEETPEAKWKRLGYFTTIKGLLTFLVDNELREGMNLKGIEQLVTGQQQLYFLIAGLNTKELPKVEG